MQEYAKMTKMLGDRRINVILPDGSESLAVIPGRFRKRCWMKTGDILLISRREFQDDKLDVIYKYNDDEIRSLVKLQEIPHFFLDPNARCDTKNTNEDIGITIQNEENINFDEI